MASTSKSSENSKTVKVLTVHNVMGTQQIFNNQNYSWTIGGGLIEVSRNDGKWHAYFPMANIVEAEVEEVEVKELKK